MTASSSDLAPLVSILSREQSVYQALLDVAEEERSAIVGRKLPELKVALQRKQDILARLASLEDRRVAWLRRFARKHGLTIENISLASIIEQAEADDRQKLTRLHRALRRRIERVADMNKVTSSLLAGILDSNDASLHFLLADDGAGATYSPRGRLQAGAGGRQLLEARA
ncbi:MAG: flagellar protein FlgN [Chloroflexi bacterium]|nr:flagellar protein FlgN [Chloroflexota bacterium]